MHHPALSTSSSDEALQQEVIEEQLPQCAGVLQCGERAPPAGEKRLKSAPQIHARWRPLRPHGVSVDDSEYGENAPYGVGGQRPVEVAEVARARDDRQDHDDRPNRARFECRTVERVHIASSVFHARVVRTPPAGLAMATART